MFSNVCVSIDQPLDADNWLSSVEEMDRRASSAKDAARMARRKLMMGFALRTDAKNPDQGVFIERTDSEREAADESAVASALGADVSDSEEMLSLLIGKSVKEGKAGIDTTGRSSLLHSAPFLSKAISYMQRHHVMFEHIDLWVPSFVPNGDQNTDGGTSCRLCYAGSATVDYKVGSEGKCNVALSGEEHFMLQAFGDYSQKFSFDVGCGLPGRVYQSGLPTWEQSVQNAPHRHFERCGGALQWGIKTVVGIPISSPNVGRIVVTLYSREDREKNQDLVGRLSEEFNRLMPSPKWKLVVDIGEPENEDPSLTESSSAPPSNGANISPPSYSPSYTSTQRDPQDIVPIQHTTTQQSQASMHAEMSQQRDDRVEQIVSLLGEFMPSEPGSQYASYLPGFMSLRLMLLRPSKTPDEQEQMRTVLGSFSSYSATPRPRGDIALMLAKDYMFLTQQHQNQHQQNQHQHQQNQQHQNQQQQPPLQMSNASHAYMSQHQPQQVHQSIHQAQLAPAQQQQAPGFPFYGYSSHNEHGANGNYLGSPSLAPLPISGNGTDTVSIVSN